MRKARHLNLMHWMALSAFLVSMAWAADKGWAGEKYPTRIIQIIFGFAPGTTDVAIRPFTDKLPDYLGQPTSFVYKPGGAGAIAASNVARSKPDGYTLFGTSSGPIVINTITQEGLDYTLDDFLPIVRLVRSTMILAVKADSPLKTLRDVIEEAKKNPGKLTFSTAGTFTSPQIVTEIFSRLAKIQLTHVPCTGQGPAVTALLGGHVTMTSSSMAPITPHLQSKALRGLVVYQKERLKDFPEIPTASELGYPVVYSNWYGIVGPKNLPKEILKELHEAFKKVIEDNRKFIEERLTNLSLMLDFQGPEEFSGAALKGENEVVKKVVKELMSSGQSTK